ncbi:SAM-dependent methyltransferase [Frankia sp. CNm7]|uniref:SAM-dependent methyltransferase n=1 Tax=Frankia nepalensis TaxID=1836974 RepID=UPI001931D1D7|nr:SAM-dependent methyltransferase [Frankia nepalensis]MBL7521167.1 SAM-dependent methyltransferase [Frankia nepalensis]
MTSNTAPGPDRPAAPTLDVTVPHSARVWNYWLGGKDNYPVDRSVGEQVREVYPEIIDVARESRAFLARVVRFLVGEAGIRQFLDIGTGLPTAGNTHEVAQRIAPESRVVYVDRDPLVLVHARALLTSTPQGATAYVDADVRDPGAILAAADGVLDFTRPVGLMMLGVLGNVADLDEAYEIVKRLVDAIPAGSYLVVNDGTIADAEAARGAAEVARRRKEAGDPYYPRTPAQFARYVAGLELIDPGVVSTPLWRPEPGTSPRPIGSHGAVARKP